MLSIWAKMLKNVTITVLKELKNHLKNIRPGISKCDTVNGA